MIDSTSMIQIIGNFGFPIALTIYLLLRFEQRLESLRTAIDRLSKIISETQNKPKSG